MIYRFLCALIAVLTLSVTSTFAQQPPDMEAIEDSINNPGSRFYYAPLMARYRAMDSTLTATDFHYLYYGYAEQPSYMPLIDNSSEVELTKIMEKRNIPTSDDYFRVIALCKSILEIEPFNLRDINALAYTYAQIGQDELALKLRRQMELIVETIKSTGTGLTEQSPYWITYFDHAADLLNLMECRQSQPIILSRTVQFSPVSNMPQKGQQGYYFNFSQIYARKPDYLNEVKVPKRKMSIKPWEPSSTFKL